MKTRSFWLVLLAACLVLSCFTACGSEPETGPVESEKPTEAGTTDAPAESETRLEPDLPDKTYDREIHVMHWTVDSAWIPWEEIDVGGIDNGDTMNDAVLDRNATVTERFGMTFSVEYVYTVSMGKMIDKLVNTSDPAYDLIVQRSVGLSEIYTQGFFYDLDSLLYTDTTKPWWNRDSLDSLALGNVHQFAASDMLLLDKSATSMVMYNATVAENYEWAVGDLYQKVKDDRWTFEEMIGICEDVSTDLNDDGVSNGEEDILGMFCGDDPIHFLFNGAGFRFMSQDGHGHYEYTFGSPESILTVQTIYEDLMYAPFFHNGWLKPIVTDMFRADKCLFLPSGVKGVNAYRDMESNYGVLPIPKFTEDQTSFYSEVSPHHDSILGVPLSAPDTEAISVALEALSAESYYSVYPLFYNVIITGRSVRDEQSKEMLKIVFDTRVYDAGLIYDLEGFAEAVLRHTTSGNSDIASLYASYKDRIEERLDELNGIIDGLNALK